MRSMQNVHLELLVALYSLFGYYWIINLLLLYGRVSSVWSMLPSVWSSPISVIQRYSIPNFGLLQRGRAHRFGRLAIYAWVQTLSSNRLTGIRRRHTSRFLHKPTERHDPSKYWPRLKVLDFWCWMRTVLNGWTITVHDEKQIFSIIVRWY